MNPPVPDAVLDGEEDDNEIVDPADEHGDVRELDLSILILLENIIWFKKTCLPVVETIVVALNRTAFLTSLVRLMNFIDTFSLCYL